VGPHAPRECLHLSVTSAYNPLLHTGVTTLAISPNRRLVAVAEKTPERGIVTLYEVATLKRKKVRINPLFTTWLFLLTFDGIDCLSTSESEWRRVDR
jgi:hypothetical protein